MIKMTTMPIFGKNSSKILSRTNRPISTKFGMYHRVLEYYNVFICLSGLLGLSVKDTRVLHIETYVSYRPPALSQTRLSRKPHLCRIDPSLPSVSPYMLLYFNLACVEHGYDENSAVSK